MWPSNSCKVTLNRTLAGTEHDPGAVLTQRTVEGRLVCKFQTIILHISGGPHVHRSGAGRGHGERRGHHNEIARRPCGSPVA